MSTRRIVLTLIGITVGLATTGLWTAEVFDNKTGQAGIIIVNSHPVR